MRRLSAQSSLTGWFTALIGLVSLGVLVRWRLNSTWLVLAGAAAGLFHMLA
jgi:hypothetical protein